MSDVIVGVLMFAMVTATLMFAGCSFGLGLKMAGF